MSTTFIILHMVFFVVALWIVFLVNRKYATSKSSVPEPDQKPMNDNTFTNDLEFKKALLFEDIWVKYNKDRNYDAEKSLPDKDYIDYHLWETMNYEWLHKKYLHRTVTIRGKNPNIIFHGGCLGCKSQRLHGLERCTVCKYFKADWDKPDLRIDGEETATLNQRDLDNILKHTKGDE